MPGINDPGVDPLDDASPSWDGILSYSVRLGYSTVAAWLAYLACLLVIQNILIRHSLPNSLF
jgi:hypothetical protein